MDLIAESLALVDGRVLLVALIVVGAALVKGTVGFGLPLVGVSLLSNVVPVQLAAAIVTVPILVSNLWLGIQGRRFVPTLVRFWTVIGALAIGLYAGARLLAGAGDDALLLLVGLTVLAYVAYEAVRPANDTAMPSRWTRPLGILAGLTGGVLGGLSTAWGPPVLMYLTARRLPKDQFVSTVGVIWFVASVVLVVSFSSLDILTAHTATLSVLALAPMSAGLVLGQWLRGRIDQRRFQRIVLLALALVGINLLRRALA